MTDKVLLTGGFGYLGGRIAHFLSENTKYQLCIGTRNFQETVLNFERKVQVAQMDYCDDSTLYAACKGVHSLIHLASLNEIDSVKDPMQALIVNGLGTLRLLRAAERAGVERFIYFSTAHVYGAPLIGDITEDSLPRPTHPYAITHKVAEDFILAANKNKILKGVVLRLSNGFGVPASVDVNRWSLLVNDLCKQAVVNKTLVLRSAGLQRRDFITLTDIARATLHFLTLKKQDDPDSVYNLGGECSLRIIDVAERIASRCEIVLGYRPSISRPESSVMGDPGLLKYSIDKLKATGFHLEGNMDDEIDQTLCLCDASFKKNPIERSTCNE